MPERIQLRRTKGWHKPDDAIVVARPSKWGNPWRVGDTVSISGVDPAGLLQEGSAPLTAEMAVELYRQIMDVRLTTLDDSDSECDYVQRWRDALEDLRGHDLACWCPLDQPCHADVLLELANRLGRCS